MLLHHATQPEAKPASLRLEAWARQHGLVAQAAPWVTADRLGLALERVDINSSALLQGTRAEIEARVGDSNPKPRPYTVSDLVLLCALADTFAARGWPAMLDTEDLGSLLAARLSSGRIQLLLSAYGGRLGRFIKVGSGRRWGCGAWRSEKRMAGRGGCRALTISFWRSLPHPTPLPCPLHCHHLSSR